MPKYTKENKKQKRVVQNKTKKMNGGIFGFFEGNKTEDQKQSSKKMNYKIVSPAYNGKTMICEVCSQTSFYSIDVSVDRSKTATLGTEFVFGDGASDFINHPLKMYTCIECNMCKFMYQSTTWNGITQKIVENEPLVVKPPVVKPPIVKNPVRP
jgi:hypothetical protein